ncbi:MFS transporter [Arthrobacter cavernae]|uniref:MFS transporter n=1 Tax=Arthrobacter cavernae TaxID=2817681 RepID=A0A939KMI6_9MICC|nr:MFS transporter [Arthrobacter cavernae]MBO1268333.1 MFS transporter [Arthrobacter cavernae]
MDTAHQRATHRTGAKLRLFVPVLIALELFSGLVQGWIVPLLGEIGRVYDVPAGATSWVFAVGLLSSAVSVPLLAMLGDRFGHQKLLVISVTLVAAGSLLIAFAPNFTLLLLGVAVQGPVAAFLPLDMALLKAHRLRSANRDIGLIVGTLTIGLAAGMVLSGVALDALGSLAVVQMIPAIGITLLVPAIWLLVPETSPDATRRIDWKGAVFLGTGLVGIMFGLSEAPHQGWTSSQALLPLAAGIIALLLFFGVEKRAESPLVDLKVIRASRLGMPIGIGFLGAVTMFGNQAPPVLYLTANPNLLGYGGGLSAAAVGMVLAISSASLALGTFVSYPVGRAIGQKAGLVFAFLVSAAALLCLAFVPSSAVLVIVWMAVAGFGNGIVLSALPAVVIDRAPASAPASASGVYNTARTIGGSLAGAFVASVTTVLVVSVGGSGSTVTAPSLQAFQVIWTVFAVLNVAAAVASIFLSRGSAEGQEETALADSDSDRAPVSVQP